MRNPYKNFAIVGASLAGAWFVANTVLNNYDLPS